MKHIPKIDLLYWALIISANTMGETAGDLISQTFNLGYGGGTLVLLILFLVVLGISIYSNSQKPLVYWTVITLASTLGTTISDYLSRTLSVNYLGVTQEVGYIYATLFLIIALVLTFGIWKWYANTDTIESGLSRTTEFLYWIAILTSSTLGTAFGDLLAHDTMLGFGGGTLMLIGLLAVVVMLYYFSKISRSLLYWLTIYACTTTILRWC
jgi:uncharacterized membrane-anchored protein